jgi:F-type H+-transporting ATPase subunit epsilon
MISNRQFQVDVVTPVRTIYSNRVVAIQVKAWDGYLGVLANHALLLEQLGYGELRLTEPDGRKVIFAIGGGFMEVTKEKTVILADAAERPEEIDLARAEAARERAQLRVSGRLETDDFDKARAEASLQRAINRIKVAQNPDLVNPGR